MVILLSFPFDARAALYSIGEPSDQEQLYLEYINRARTDPGAEGLRLANTTDPDVRNAYTNFNVNLPQMQAEFATNPLAPPLALNAKMLAAARLHTGDMYTNQFQGTPGTDGSTPGTRLTAQGYPWTNLAENVFVSAKSVFHGYAALSVDWGPGPTGMNPTRPSRRAILSAAYREAGIGVIDGTNGTVGPQIVTQDFASQAGALPMITGVVFYDFNTNGFYDLGEGVGGVNVQVSGSSNQAISSASGGYAVPVSSNGNYTVTFTAAGLSNQQTATISLLRNVKRDFLPVYSPPVLSGPDPAVVNQVNHYTFTPVGAAVAYQSEQMQLLPYGYVEGGENGLANLVTNTSPDYPLLVSDLKVAGNNSLHLCHVTPEDQSIMLNTWFRPTTNSQISFYKRLGWARVGQVARAQVSVNGSPVWTDIWSQAGNDSESDTNFVFVRVSLAAYTNRTIRIRFLYDYVGGDFFQQSVSEVGLCLDNISFLNTSQAVNRITNDIPAGTICSFLPTNTGNFLLRVRALLPGRTLDWGPALHMTVAAVGPTIQLLEPSFLAPGQFQVDFNVNGFSPGMTFELWKSSDLASWSRDMGASLQTVTPNSRFRFQTPTGGAPRTQYRVKANN